MKPSVVKFITFSFLTLGGLFFLAVPAQAAKLYFSPSTINLNPGQTSQVELRLDTEGKKVSGTDVRLDYSATGVSLTEASFAPLFPVTAFDNSEDDQGQAYLSAMFEAISGEYNGNDRLATLTVRAESAGSHEIRLVCQAGATNETNILETGSWQDIVNCGSLGKLTITEGAEEPSDDQGGSGGSGGSGSGGSGSGNSGRGGVTACQDTPPPVPNNLTATTGPGRGQISLQWNEVTGADYYTVSYGERQDGFTYGAPNIGKTTNFVVSGLKPGVLYYLATTAVKGCASSGHSSLVSAYAGSGATYIPPAVTSADTTAPAADQLADTGLLPGDTITSETTTIGDEVDTTVSQDYGPPLASPAVTTGQAEPQAGFSWWWFVALILVLGAAGAFFYLRRRSAPPGQ